MFEKMKSEVFLGFLSRFVKFKDREQKSLDGDEVPKPSFGRLCNRANHSSQFASLTSASTLS